ELVFDWDTKASAWDAKFEGLQRYKERVSDCNVPLEWTENPQLGRWVSNQRCKKRQTAEQKARLNALGFVWRTR
ncbi:MAG TPA: helicase associated domain-containing protein, partial [Methyloceanibacter sp.]